MEHVIDTISYSNNELGPKSIELIDSLINSTFYNNLTSLNLSNLTMSESSISMLFESLSNNYTLGKLRLSGINLGRSRNIHLLTNFLHENSNTL